MLRGERHGGPMDPTSIPAIIARVAPELGIAVSLESTYGRVGQLTTPDGRRFYFRGANVDLNTLGAAEIAQDKGYASYFMAQLGYPVPEGRTFYSNRWSRRIGSDQNKHAAYQYAQEIGFPVIVKPNSKSQGIGVQKVDDREDLYTALDFVSQKVRDKVALVQKPVIGDDYRILVLDDEVIAAYRRTPLSVVGDGQSTIFDLMIAKQERFIAAGRDTRLKLNDPRISTKLRTLHLDVSTIPISGQRVFLLDNANLSSGGDAEDVTEMASEGYKKIAIQLTKDMGLRFCGVDIITPDPIEQPTSNFTVIEVNAAPGVDYYTQIGAKQQQVVEGLYKKILLALLEPPKRLIAVRL